MTGGSDKVQTILTRSLGEIGVEATGMGLMGSVRSAMVCAAELSKVMSSKGISGTSPLRLPMLKSIDPYSHSSQTPTTLARADCSVFSRFLTKTHSPHVELLDLTSPNWRGFISTTLSVEPKGWLSHPVYDLVAVLK